METTVAARERGLHGSFQVIQWEQEMGKKTLNNWTYKSLKLDPSLFLSLHLLGGNFVQYHQSPTQSSPWGGFDFQTPCIFCSKVAQQNQKPLSVAIWIISSDVHKCFCISMRLQTKLQNNHDDTLKGETTIGDRINLMRVLHRLSDCHLQLRRAQTMSHHYFPQISSATDGWCIEMKPQLHPLGANNYC